MSRSGISAYIIMFLACHTAFAGDAPCTATVLPTNMTAFAEFSTIGTTASGIPAPSCGNYSGTDFWFEVTIGPSGRLYIASKSLTLTDGALAVYRGTCQSLEAIGCFADDLCGQTMMPITTFYDLTPGELIFIRFWAEAGTPNGAFEFYAGSQEISPPLFTLTGNATYINDDCIRLTQNSQNQQGCAWLPTPVDFSVPFTHTMSANFGNQTADGADGICLVYQNNGSAICGNSGQGIGAAGIPNSLIIEFDTWQNPNQNDPVQDHVSVNINGDMDHANSISPVISLGEIEDGLFHDIVFQWQPVTITYTVLFDGVVQIQGNFDVVGQLFGGDPFAFWGYTASTGGSTNEQIICPNVERFPHGSRDTIFVDICEGESHVAGGQPQTTSGTYADVLTNARNCDSIIITELTVIPSLETTIDTVLCIGACIDIDGTPYCNSGNETITLTSLNTGCDSIVNLNLSILSPLAVITSAFNTLNCITDEITLDGSSSFTTPNGTYDWHGPMGFISDESNIMVTNPGIYKLIVSASLGNVTCISDTTSFEILIDTIAPIADAGADIILRCGDLDTFLDASNSSIGPDYSLQWNFENGFYSDEIRPQAFLTGNYTLIVVNNENGCVSTDDVQIIPGDPPPPLTASGGELTCAIETLTLSLDTLFAGSTYSWIGPDSFESSISTPTIDQPGTYQLTVQLEDGCLVTTSAFVSIDSVKPDVRISGDSVISCATPQVLLSAHLADTISFIWNTPTNQTLTDSIISAGIEGVYILIGTAENGCTSADSIEISSSDQVPQYDLNANTITCSELSIQLNLMTLDTANNYQWSGPNAFSSIDQNPQILIPGFYFLSVTGNTGCLVLDSIEVRIDTIPPLLNLLSDTITCDNETATIYFLEDSTGILFNWTGPNTFESIDPFITVSIDGPYQLTATAANGCQIKVTHEVASDLDTLPIIVSSAPELNCEITSAAIYLLAPTNRTPVWSGPGTINLSSDSLNVSESGNYQVTVINHNGCISMADFTITEDIVLPAVTVNDVTITCDQSSAIVAATYNDTYTYEWFGPQNITNDSSQFITTAPGIYFLTVTSDNSCQSTYQAAVIADTMSPFIALNDITLNCDGATTYTIENPPNYIYAWTGPMNFQSSDTDILVSTSGDYMLEITNPANGCINNFSMMALPPDTPMINNYSIDNANCIMLGSLTDIAVSGGLPPYRFAINNGMFATDSIFSSLKVGAYTVQVIDENNCKTSSEFSIPAYDELAIELIASIELIEGTDSIQLNPNFIPGLSVIDSISWSPIELISCAACPYPYLINATSGIISIWAADTNGCIATAATQLLVKPELFYIPNSFSPNNDGINDDFRVYSTAASSATISNYQIFNRWGDRVYERSAFNINNNKHWWDGTFRDNDLTSDVFVYVIGIITENGVTKNFKGEIHLAR